MPVGIEAFDGDRLKQAKNARGLSSVQLSELSGISDSSISLYERNRKKPQQKTLEAIAIALNMSPDYFILNNSVPQVEHMFFRSNSSATKTARKRIKGQYQWVLDIVEYLSKYFDFPALNLPLIDGKSNVYDIETHEIEAAAQLLRESWELDSAPMPNLVELAEKNGIVVYRTSFATETCDAFSEFRENHPVIGLSSDKKSYYRSRFDLAHELGHLMLHRNIKSSSLKKPVEFKLLEDQAHYFAGCFLLPEESYSKDVWAPSLETFRSLKPRWKVSIAMQITRCNNLGLFGTEDETKRAWINLSRRKWRNREPLDDSTPAEEPSLIKNSIKILLDSEIKTKKQIADDLLIPPGDIERLLGYEAGFISESDEPGMPKLKTSSNVVSISQFASRAT